MLARDLNTVTRNILIRQGKGRKPRTVYLGDRSRKAVRAYLARHQDNCPALWITDDGDRLQYWGLRQVLRGRSRQAGIQTPQIDAFWRAFALNCLRAGVDNLILSELMNRASLKAFIRYLKQIGEDLEQSEREFSPAGPAF